MSRTVDLRHLTKLDGGLSRLHSADDDVVQRQASLGRRNLAQINRKKNGGKREVRATHITQLTATSVHHLVSMEHAAATGLCRSDKYSTVYMEAIASQMEQYASVIS